MPSAPSSPRFVVGIDLGTTHTVAAYADLASKGSPKIEVFPIEQLVAPGELAARPLLPSARYHPADGELTESDTRLPWPPADDPCRPIIGELARSLGAKSRGRLVASAKSWLSHAAVDRTAAILPWGAPEDVAKVSPLAASAGYLAHVRSSWNHRFPDHPLEDQEIVVTVPASFDEMARSLTLEAARMAGFGGIHLAEEPQAAVYDWLWRHRRSLGNALADVKLLLVVDVGGGTTDLTLIRVAPGTEGPELLRVGVGNHLMLGGDNIDLALAHRLESRLTDSDRRLSSAEFSQLIEQCRCAKEKLLAVDAPERATVTLLGAGSRLIGAARSTELSQEEVRDIVLDGFFPLTGMDELPDRKRSGVVEFGLPYAADPAISKQLAAFLHQHRQIVRDALGEDSPPIPDAVLLNGGPFQSPVIAGRLLDVIANWRQVRPRQLKNEQPDLAVARGAVASALARRGLAVQKIGGGSARSYFLVIDTDGQNIRAGVCILPRGTEEGSELVLADRCFSLRLAQPVRFHLVSSTGDTTYRLGELVDIDDDTFAPLPPLAVAFDADNSGNRQEVAVRLAATLTDVGTLRLQCVSIDAESQRWDVEFQLRGHGKTQALATAAGLNPRCADAADLIRAVYGKKTRTVDPKAVKGLRQELEKLLGKREGWNMAELRELSGALLDGLPHRRRSPDHERLWLSLAGYCLRPGFGYPLDDWRMAQVWGIYEQGVQFIHEAQVWAEWWTLWRRIAGGLDAAAQRRIFDDIADFINPATAKRGNMPAMAKKRSYEDMLRLLAVLERLPVADKIDMGAWLLQRLSKSVDSAETYWALGRIGARIPFHGSAHEVIPPAAAAAWLEQMLTADWKQSPSAAFAATLIARMCGDRERDVDDSLRQRIVERLRLNKCPDSWIGMVTQWQQLEASDEKRIFGENLPAGLRLVS